ncbi:MAG: anchored repeat ABC transporter, substrate-binding protein [Corynebacterium sp.]|uniref:anchored repeat ABC transporter, substrate-binding protein n=1 Tax=Corynebacterium sp. TaxID=1720 RepID=UPI0026DDC2B5|nr:anchored repeat ABC transporter, substrate-binding protein [Corynebacterium sp.]MDO5097225.1 anchored repeat ABC transporter, substrate-binding protein [Corynebacterium sp.]
MSRATRGTRMPARTYVGIALGLAGVTLAGCAVGATSTTLAGAPNSNDSVVDVVATTPIIADLAQNVAGDRARVTSVMPLGSDPHSFEPGLRSVRTIAHADIIFSNGLLLEQQSLVRTAQESRLPEVPFVELADQSPRHGGELIPLVENVALDTVWLGMRIAGDGAEYGATKTSGVDMRLKTATGPGDAAAYVTSTFGYPEVLFNTKDGIDADDSTTLPVDAHTHVSWAFSKPGEYRLTFGATLDTPTGPVPIDDATITLAVGVDPHTIAAKTNAHIIDSGHVDVTADITENRLVLRGDAPTGTDTTYTYEPDATVVVVPPSVLQTIPGEPAFRFLGNPGAEVYLLPQAVLGKHVHGEVDPHLWHSVKNTIAMVRVIQDELIAIDPGGRAEYVDNANEYVEKLEDLDRDMRETIAQIPPHRRHLVTTHDGYAYLGDDYDINIAGFVTPNPAIEPSPRDVIALTRTLENLHVPAVFLEPKLAGRAGVLSETALRLGIEICTIRGDTLDAEVPTYLALMRTNVDELARCLGQPGT